MASFTPAQIQAIIRCAQHVKENRRKFFNPANWQRDLYRLGAEKQHVLVSAANQSGKTEGGTAEYAYHLTCDYPDWWDGIYFKHAPLAWCAGVNLQQIEEVTQLAIFGERSGDKLDNKGYITNADLAGPIQWNRQRPSVMEGCAIKNRYGKAKHRFKAYSMTGADKKKAQSLAGTTKLDFLLVDEQPPEMALGQMIQRTMHGKHISPIHGPRATGAVRILYTPELGADAIYEQFKDKPVKHQGFMNVTWDDLEERIMTQEMKDTILTSLPPHEREMRSKGIPIMSGSLVYPVAQEDIEIPPFEIPPWYRRIIGIDFGITHPFAAVLICYNPEEDVMYVTQGYKKSDELPPQHSVKLRAMGAPSVPVSYPHDGDTREKRTGETLMTAYKEAGITNIRRFENPDGTIYREPGVLDILNRMLSGRFKVFSSVIEFFYEMRLYHRDQQGNIVDANDDMLSAARYAAGMVQRFGVTGNQKSEQAASLAAYYKRMRKVS